MYTREAKIFKRPEKDLKRSVAQLGRGLGGPWRADEKTASLAAWLALVSQSGTASTAQRSGGRAKPGKAE
jgi:hypothetical protein